METLTLPNDIATRNKLYYAAKYDFKTFVTEVLHLENQPFHDELDDDISQDFRSDDPVARFFSVITMPRDHGKSKHLSIAYPLWRMAKNHNVRILCVSRSGGVAESFLTEIVGNIERNQEYIDWAKGIDPDHVGVVPHRKPGRQMNQDWSGKQITIERTDNLKDPTIMATGLFGQILSRRADIIICDDVVDQENSMTELQRNKVKDWLETTVIPVLVPGGTFIYLGNTWHMDDVVSKFMTDPRFLVQKRKQAIVKEAVNQDLWKEWGAIMLNITVPPHERRKQANDFYELHRADMDEGWQTLWPERYPYGRLYFERLLNPYTFARMYQCDPSNRPTQVIRDEWIMRALERGKNLRFQDLPHQRVAEAGQPAPNPPANFLEVSAGGMDLAVSQNEWADDTALVYVDLVRHGYDGIRDGDYVIRQIHRGHMTPNEQRMSAGKAYKEHKLMSIRVESVGYQEALTFALQEDGVTFTSYHTNKEKFDPEVGINMVANIMETDRLVIPSDTSDPRTVDMASKLANEMRAFPDGHTGDSLMALWFAMSECNALLGTRVLMASTSRPMIPPDPPPMRTPEQRAPEEEKADTALRLESEYERSNFNQLMKASILQRGRR